MNLAVVSPGETEGVPGAEIVVKTAGGCGGAIDVEVATWDCVRTCSEIGWRKCRVEWTQRSLGSCRVDNADPKQNPKISMSILFF